MSTEPKSRPTGAGREWPIIAALGDLEARLGAGALRRGPWFAGLYEFLRFGIKQGWACLFGGSLLGLIVASRLWYPAGAGLSRYDALTLAACAIQAALLLLRLETIQEAKVILVFHIVGTVMEVFKTGVGSWVYPEASLLRVGHVPLFTGFMYAAVGSYLFRVWRLFDFRFDRHPRPVWLVVLSIAIYANFFADHWGFDLRWPLIAAAAALFGPTVISFTVWRDPRRMPLLLGIALVALFIWFGENLGTASHAWLYPGQVRAWTVVSPGKLTSWFLLMLISYTMAVVTMFHNAGPARRAPGRLPSRRF